MAFKINSFKNRKAFTASLAAAALVISLGSPAATAAGGDRHIKPHRVHNTRPLYMTYGPPAPAHRATLPHGPEYGFLRAVPPNAIRMPGYTFVPGIGILGESCDMPTSACTNEYRDVQ